MVQSIILDLDSTILTEYQDAIEKLAGNYHIFDATTATLPDCSQSVVLLDCKERLAQWKSYAVIGVEHGSSIYGTSYVIDSTEALDDFLLELAFCRTHHLPVTIANTARLIIREFCENDFGSLLHLYRDPMANEFIPPLADVATEQAKLTNYINHMYPFYNYGLWAVIDKASGHLIGRAGIERCNINGNEYPELAYLIDPDYRGQGLAYEACLAILQYAREYGLESLYLRVSKKNAPSIALAEKLGFVFDAEQTDGTNPLLIYRIEL